MTDVSLAQHLMGARDGFTSSAISTNSAIQSRRTTRSTNYAALVIGRCGSIHSGFGSTIPQGSPRTHPPGLAVSLRVRQTMWSPALHDRAWVSHRHRRPSSFVGDRHRLGRRPV